MLQISRKKYYKKCLEHDIDIVFTGYDGDCYFLWNELIQEHFANNKIIHGLRLNNEIRKKLGQKIIPPIQLLCILF